MFIKKVSIENLILHIPENSNLKKISQIIEKNNLTPSYKFPYYLSIFLNYDRKLSYGEFLIKKNDTLYSILKKIRNRDIYYRKLTIIEGFEIYQLKNLLNNSLLKIEDLDIYKYNLVADTFNYYKNQKLNKFFIEIDEYTKNIYKKNNLSKDLSHFSLKEIIIISSLVEKEAKTDNDKRLVSSVIFNRLKKNMKLDIDASVIFSITEGKYKLDRKLKISDLKIDSPYNTYKNKGIPPKPICLPGSKTLKIVLEANKSPFYFYFYDENKLSHIFSKNYKEHLSKLNEYRNK